VIDLTLPATVALFFAALYIGLYAAGLVIERVRYRAERKQRLGDRWRVFWSEEDK
jgi:hypothetical protein